MVVLFPRGIKVYGYVTLQTDIDCSHRQSSSASTVVVVGHHRCHLSWLAVVVIAVLSGSRARCRLSRSAVMVIAMVSAVVVGAVLVVRGHAPVSILIVAIKGGRRRHLRRSQSAGVRPMVMRQSF